jgi:carbamoyl-phosphate synthase large subunit
MDAGSAFNQRMKMKNQPAINVLISGAGTATCQSVIKAYRNQQELDVTITTIDMNPQSAGRYLSDHFYQVPPAASADFIPRVFDICQKENIQLLIPIVDYEFQKLAENKEKFKAVGCRIAISPLETIQICTDKLQTYQFFTDHQIPTPETKDASVLSPADFERLNYPLFIKPRVGRATLDTARIDSRKALEVHLQKEQNFIIQKYLEGQEYTIDVLNNFQGKTVGVVPRTRLETKSGVSYKGQTEKNDLLIEKAQFITEKVGIRGHANIQCFVTAEGVRFTEINPRYAGTMVLSLAAGFNSPLLLAKITLGMKVPSEIGQFSDGVLMLRYWQEVFIDKQKPFRLAPV